MTYDTKPEWVVYNLEGKNVNLKCDSGYCEGMPYTELSDK